MDKTELGIMILCSLAVGILSGLLAWTIGYSMDEDAKKPVICERVEGQVCYPLQDAR